MVTIIFLPRLNLYVGWGGPHFGLMHLVATNVIAWIWHVLKVHQLICTVILIVSKHFQESMHEYHEVKKKSSDEADEDEEVEKHPGGEACEEKSPFGNIVLVLEPVLFAFAIEFVLIGELEQNVKENIYICVQVQQFSPTCGFPWATKELRLRVMEKL